MSSPSVAKLRRLMLEQWIEEAIALLDQIDGDPDLEDCELEADPADLGIADIDGLYEQRGQAV